MCKKCTRSNHDLLMYNHHMKKLLLLPLLFLSIAQAEMIQCESMTALTGDMILCNKAEGQKLKIKLSGLVAPKTGQAYANESRQLLSELIMPGSFDEANKITVYIFEQDTENNAIGIVYREYPAPDCSPGFCCEPISPMPVSRYLLEHGLAWYTPDDFRKDYIIPREQDLEQKARAAKRGLWADKNPVAPWEWRKQKKGKK